MKDGITVWTTFWHNTTLQNDNINRPACDGQVQDCVTDKPPDTTTNKGVITLAAFGCLIFGFGVVLLLVQPYELLFNWKCVFSPGGEIYELWRKPPVDLYLKVYLFNITNKDAFMEGREKLRVEQVGPYVYRELLAHENVTFNDNGTLTSYPSHELVWTPELSEGHSEDDQLVLPHIALLAISHVVAEKSYFTQFGLNLLIRQSNSQPLLQMSAKEFMFGYKSSLLTLGNQFMSEWIYFDKLGLIDRMYDFQGDFETIYTGERDVRKTGLTDTYRGLTQLPQFDGACGNVRNASDGTKFQGYLKPEDKLSFYRKSLCRVSSLVHVNSTVASGLDGYYYSYDKETLNYNRNHTNNTCYCRNQKCLPNGIADMTDCYYGFPIGVSYPHFLHADESLLDGVEGSKPDPALHESYFIIEPVSGLPLKVAARHQINMVLGNLEPIAHVGRFSNMVLPMLWTEISMSGLPHNLNVRFYFYLYVAPILQTAFTYLSFIIGTILLTIASYKYLQRIKTIGKLYVTTWKDPYCVEEDINRKLSTYAYSEREVDEVHNREFDGLIVPLNRDIEIVDCDPLQNGVV